jgi:hypothetical protein
MSGALDAFFITFILPENPGKDLMTLRSKMHLKKNRFGYLMKIRKMLKKYLSKYSKLSKNAFNFNQKIDLMLSNYLKKSTS